MHHIERELKTLERMIAEAELDSPEWLQIYAAKQALAWVLDPMSVASPMVQLTRDNYGLVVPDAPLEAIEERPS